CRLSPFAAATARSAFSSKPGVFCPSLCAHYVIVGRHGICLTLIARNSTRVPRLPRRKIGTVEWPSTEEHFTLNGDPSTRSQAGVLHVVPTDTHGVRLVQRLATSVTARNRGDSWEVDWDTGLQQGAGQPVRGES